MQYKTLNLGCGDNKIPDCLNVDINESLHPDQVLDFTKSLSYADETFENVLFFHTIEHIPKKYHPFILSEIRRVLKKNGYFYCSYPEFKKCAQNYIDNHKGQREFWEATIYGRQRDKFDYHVALMDTEIFSNLLRDVGLEPVAAWPEPDEPYYTIVRCLRSKPLKTYEEVILEEVYGK